MLHKLQPLSPSTLKGGWVKLLEEFSHHLGAKEKKKQCCGSVNWAQCFANMATGLLHQGWPVRPLVKSVQLPAHLRALSLRGAKGQLSFPEKPSPRLATSQGSDELSADVRAC